MNLFLKSTLLPKNQPPCAFTEFYDTYAPRLWGLILLANLPPSQSETILINTLLNAWQQVGQTSPIDDHYLSMILQLAYQEGLPVNAALEMTIRQRHHS